MVQKHKSILIGALLAGTAAIALYHSMEGSAPLRLLGSGQQGLPDVSADTLLPPPEQFYTAALASQDVPGVRRLKVLRPPIQADGPNASQAPNTVSIQTGQEFYLTGTRSAALIRKPVEARIETFPSVTIEQAVEGALALDEWGFGLVQAFLNQSLGDEAEINVRARSLLDGLAAQGANYDLTTLADAANLVVEASARSYWSAFMAPFVFDPSFKLKEDALGWDLGPNAFDPYDNFVRVDPEDDILVGDNMTVLWSDKAPSILNQGIENPDQFVARDLENGNYRLVLLTSDKPDGSSPLYPFGVDLKKNGAGVNMIDTRATDQSVPLLKLATPGPGRIGDEGASLTMISGDEAPETGYLLSSRVEVVDGTLRVEFNQLGGQVSYITAVLLYPEPDSELTDELTTYLAEFLSNIQTAAGPGQRTVGDVLPLVDPTSSFADASGGLPTFTGNPLAAPDGFGNIPTGLDIGGPIVNPVPDIGTTTGGDTTTTGGGTTTTGGDTTTSGGASTSGGGSSGGGTPPPELIAEAGIYDPIPLGEDFSLNGCGSTLASEALCNLTDTSLFELTWLLGDTVLGTGAELLLGSGDGTPFDTTGDYDVTLQVRYDGSLLTDGEFVNLITGGSLFLPGDLILTSVDTALLRVIATVPEPEMLAVLLPGLFYTGYRMRRRKKKQV